MIDGLMDYTIGGFVHVYDPVPGPDVEQFLATVYAVLAGYLLGSPSGKLLHIQSS